MKGMTRIAIGMGLLLALGVTAQAQAPAAGGAGGARQGRGGGGQRGGGATLATLPISALDAVVTLTADQKEKITKIQSDYKAANTAAAGDRTAMTAARTKATQDAEGVLTSDQKAKWTEMSPAVNMLNQSKAILLTVLADVKLTADQWTKIKTAAADANTKIQALPQADRRTGRAPIVAEFKTTVEALLTADQKKVIEAAPKPAAPGAAVL
jgi:hypothetical protein